MLEVAIFGVLVWGGFVLKDLLDRILVISARNENDIYQLTQEIRSARLMEEWKNTEGVIWTKEYPYASDPWTTAGGPNE